MTSERLIDPELLPLLKQIPSLELSVETLPGMREAIINKKPAIPNASNVRVEEHFVAASDGHQIRVVVYCPKETSPTGGLLWIHGGGMVMGVPEMNDALNRHLVERAGCLIVAVQYRLAPECPYPAGLEDCYTALRWMYTKSDELDIARERISVAGGSGGGTLAAGLALLARDRGEIQLSAQFLMFAMLDDRTGTVNDPTPMPFAGEFVWNRASNTFCWNAVLANASEDADVSVYAAPGRAEVLSGLPPTFISVGDVDPFVGENLRFAQGLIRDGVSTELHVYPCAAHGFTAWGAQTAIAQRCESEFCDVVTRHFRREES